ncbi:MAG: hypothetical protein ACHQ49_10415 [Elusimicrobiota bacterium]
MSAGAQILCSKCGNASAQPRAECVKCGGRNARVCGKCGAQNSVVKTFCDKCGESIAVLGPGTPAPGPVSPSPGIPLTEVKSLPTPGAALNPGGLPSPGQAAPGLGAPLDDLWSAPAPSPVTIQAASRPKARAWRGMLHSLAALLGVAAAAYGVWTFVIAKKPEILVPHLAARYLEALRTRDYAKAYAMFSDAAKSNATLEEFRASRDETAWTWSGLRIEHREPGAVLLAYDLQAGGGPPRTDHVLFTLDGERWVRPYNWTLMRQVEAAFDKGDAEQGLVLASAAATVNPRDPMAWGYLCEAAYYRKLPQETQTRCVRALELAATYPSNLSMKSLYHLHAILADTYDHALNNPARALEQYGQMLGFPAISPADQCQILLARSQAYAGISRPGEALADLERGAALCVEPADRAFIQKLRESLRAPEQP